MQNPVIASDNHTYNYMAIMQLYLQAKRPLSPLTGEPLKPVESLQPNWELRNAVSQLVFNYKQPV